ncbi:hypothetical protein MSG28_008916 [Choristoneura fumiferana]|uniref:Uncharacterized protein n=1 Tax=Choristoneura fumiferana TaxID=7141 RepID=A0ACC0J8I8_CHOFU|nr:hypothetical protein MSG28_008916 [Choristoneura fumiferana]
MLFLDYLLDLYSVSRQEDVIEDNACGGQIILAAVLSVALAQVPGYRYQPTQYQAYQARPRSFEGNAAILRSDAEASKPKSQARRQTVSKLQAATPTLATMARSTKCGSYHESQYTSGVAAVRSFAPARQYTPPQARRPYY